MSHQSQCLVAFESVVVVLALAEEVASVVAVASVAAVAFAEEEPVAEAEELVRPS